MNMLWRGTIRLYRWPLLIAFILFILGVLLGLVLPLPWKLLILEAVSTKFSDILNAADSPWQLAWGILLNNLTVAGMLYLLGFTIALPAVVVVSNGVIIGIILGLFYRVDVLLPGEFLRSVLLLIPHGVFELSAFFLASVLSVVVILKVIFTKYIEPTKTRRRVLLDSVLRFTCIVVPLLIVAAFTEVFVSGVIADQITNNVAQQTNTPSITLNHARLAEHHCTPRALTDVSASTASTTTSLVQLAQVLYDPDIYTLLRQRRLAPTTGYFFSCSDDDYIIVYAWPGAEWSLEQALDLEHKMIKLVYPDLPTFQETTTRFKLTNGVVELNTHDNATVMAIFSDATWQLSDLTE